GSVMSIFKRNRMSSEQIELLRFIESLTSDWNGIGWEDILKYARQYIPKNSDAINGALSQGQSLKCQAFSLVGSIAKEFVYSGRFHVYRGVLNLFGDDYVRIYDRSMDNLSQLHEFTEAEVAKAKMEFKEDISTLG